MEHSLKLGEILIKANLLTKAQLDLVLKEQKQQKIPLGEALVQKGVVKERDIAVALSKQLDIPYMSLNIELLKLQVTDDLKKLVPEKFARENNALPLNKHDNVLTVILEDPLRLETIDNLHQISKCEITTAVATKSDIKEAINVIYGEQNLLGNAVTDSYSMVDTDLQTIREQEEISLDKLYASAEEAPVIKLVDLIINEAIESRASDIHIEPFANYIRIRNRIDGVLYEISPPSKHMYLSIISRIKILSKIDIAEKRLPQDGSFGVKKEKRLVDIRVSTIPTVYGEKVVMRILDRSTTPLKLRDLGFAKEEHEIFDRNIHMRTGLILLTGPTGCGKTTTLYASLNEIRSPELNILTIEDPVEYRLEGINQVQINPKIGLTFAAGLRSFLRQDPDIIMVGEVRDLETAQICIRASLTGHLVFSTVHTNDAATALTRMIDIGLPPYLVTSSLVMAAAQRLMRKLCAECKEEYTPSQEHIKQLGITAKKLFKPKGCRACRMTGYSGQSAIYEILTVTDEIKDLVTKNTSPHLIKEMATKQGMRTLRENAMKKVNEGTTSIEEMLRVTIGLE